MANTIDGRVTNWYDKDEVFFIIGALLIFWIFIIAMNYPDNHCPECKECNCPGFWELHAENYSNCAVSCPTEAPELEIKPYIIENEVERKVYDSGHWECDKWSNITQAWRCFQGYDPTTGAILREITDVTKHYTDKNCPIPIGDDSITITSEELPCCVIVRGNFSVCAHQVWTRIDPYWDD